MIAPRTKGLIYLQALLDGVITFSLFWLCFAAFMGLNRGAGYASFIDSYAVYSVLVSVLVVLHAARSVHAAPRMWNSSLKEAHALSFNQVFAVAVGLSLFLVATKDKSISRLFLFSWLPVLYGVLLAANRFLPLKIARTFFSKRQERTLLAGSAEGAGALAGWMEYQRAVGMEFLALKADLAGSLAERLEQGIREHGAAQVILAGLPEAKYDLRQTTEVCERLGVRLLVFSPLERLFRHKVTLIEEAGLQFITTREEPLESPHNRAMKRALDVAVALPMVVLVLPVAGAVVWFIHRSQSPGPVFFRQPRAGLKGRPFQIWKFRSMHPGSEDLGRQAHPGDARIFPAGRWLRRSSLDELPQFINVLRGEMSLVGPRPHLIEHNQQFARVMRNYHVRAAVKPGITGLAQVRGLRGEAASGEDIIRRVESDIHYLENWSFTLDLVILARTVWQMLRPPKSAV